MTTDTFPFAVTDEVGYEDAVDAAKKKKLIAAAVAGALVLGASADPKGPGPLVSALASGQMAGNFHIPITVVPGTLTLEDLKAFA